MDLCKSYKIDVRVVVCHEAGFITFCVLAVSTLLAKYVDNLEIEKGNIYSWSFKYLEEKSPDNNSLNLITNKPFPCIVIVLGKMFLSCVRISINLLKISSVKVREKKGKEKVLGYGAFWNFEVKV